MVTQAIAIGSDGRAGFLQIQESSALYPGGPLHAMEWATQDAVLRNRNPERYGTGVGRSLRELMTIVAIDERSLTELGLFGNWPRSYCVQVIDALMTTVLGGPGHWLFRTSSEDAQVAAALERARAIRPATAVGLATLGCNCSVSWVGPDGGDWQNRSNWSTGAVPRAFHNFCIPSGGTPILANGASSANSLDSHGTVTIAGGTVSIASMSQTTALSLTADAKRWRNAGGSQRQLQRRDTCGGILEIPMVGPWPGQAALCCPSERRARRTEQPASMPA